MTFIFDVVSTINNVDVCNANEQMILILLFFITHRIMLTFYALASHQTSGDGKRQNKGEDFGGGKICRFVARAIDSGESGKLIIII